MRPQVSLLREPNGRDRLAGLEQDLGAGAQTVQMTEEETAAELFGEVCSALHRSDSGRCKRGTHSAHPGLLPGPGMRGHGDTVPQLPRGIWL